MNDAVLQALFATDDPVKKAAIIAEAVLNLLPPEVALIARRCVIFHWFDQSVIAALSQDTPLATGDSGKLYQQLISLPFIETLAEGARYQHLTRKGLLDQYAASQSELLITAVKLALPAYRAQMNSGINSAEAFFCSLVAGDAESASKLLNDLLKDAAVRENWQYISGLQQLQEEAEQFRFVKPLPSSELHWILRGLAHGAQEELEAAILDYSHAIATNPRNALTHLVQGNLYAELQRYKEALLLYERAYNLSSKRAKTYVNRGIGYFKKQRYEEARRDFLSACQLDPNISVTFASLEQIPDIETPDPIVGMYGEGTICQLFLTSVRKFGDRLAIIEPVEEDRISALSYRALQAQVYRFAGYLQQQQIAKGDRICILAANCMNWIITYLAAVLLGAVVVPLDRSIKEDELARAVDITDAKLLVTTQQDYRRLEKLLLPWIDIDDLPTGTLDVTKLPEIKDNDLAEVVFTSGTTRKPKGVMLSQHNIASNAAATLKMVDINQEDRALSILPLSHSFELTIELALLASGASIVYARSLNPETLLRLLESRRVTCMVLVPQALELFMRGFERQVRMQHKERQWERSHRIAAKLPFGLRRFLFSQVYERFGEHFRFFLSGGGYLPPKLAERWENMGIRVLQGYGATECSPLISLTPYSDHNVESVGKALPGVKVSIEADGELVVRGPNVALGYWKDPEATNVAFKDGWYQTGDLGSKDEAGRIYIKGRKTSLIVLANGLNVYPEDIENVLLTNPAVKDAVVAGVKEDDTEQAPVVHSILLMEDPSQAKVVIQQANKQLAPHQQIRSYTIWPEADFPRTHTLKTVRGEVISKAKAQRAFRLSF